jgi:hypothetical protein
MKPYTLILFGAFSAAVTISVARAQQAPIPNPPTTVHPVPKQPTDCRGCSETTDDTKTSVGKYDEKKSGTVRETVRPAVKAKPKVRPKRKTRSTKRKVTTKKISKDSTVKVKSPAKATSKSVSTVTPKPPLKDKPPVGDPVVRRIFLQ